MARTNGFTDLEGASHFWVARTHLANGKLDEALQSAEEAIAVITTTGDLSTTAQIHLFVAQLLHSRGDTKDAVERVDRALELYKKAKDTEGTKRANQVLAEIRPSKTAPAAQAIVQMVAVHHAEGADVAEVVEEQGPDLETIQSVLLETIKNSTGTEEGLDMDTPLMEAGLDSLSALELRNSLAREFGVQLSASLLFDFPTMESMAAHLHEQTQRAAKKKRKALAA
eukprot:NODE_1233_length_1202_cov_319.561465.p1 GENE.NODE_1233_length_1202_cov_319.561465~~NODE_1233_length_1202_cov_319.561465.p1  ORF type:complete len:248 (-),score=98.45 NODE_1233_length_1202_cov_319.561465:443-1120(-)